MRERLSCVDGGARFGGCAARGSRELFKWG